MRLISCHINNFGKLSNLNINFNEGVNIINQPNGWGKSTLAAFLKAMLYGFDTKKEPGAFEKERKLYKPWQGGIYGGDLDFEVEGRSYRISRTFGLTEKQDEFHLYNLKTMVECDDFSPMLGEELFDLDRNSFKRSIYIAQADCEAGSSDSINAKLGNLAANTNDINNYETALAKIKDTMNKLSPNRITGSIKKRVNTITGIEQDLRKYEAADVALEELTAKIEQKKQQKNELSNIRTEYGNALQIASADSRRKAQKANYDAILADVEEKEKSYKEYTLFFNGEIPADEELDREIAKARELDNLKGVRNNLSFSDEEKEQISVLDKKFENGVPTDEMIDDMQKKVAKVSSVRNEYGRMELKLSQMTSLAMLTDNDSSLEDKPPKTKMVPVGILLILLGLAAGACATVFSLNEKYNALEIILLVLGGVGIAFALVGIGIMVAGIKKNNQLERAYIRKVAELEEQKKAKEAPINEMKEQLELIEKGIGAVEEEVSNYFKQFGEEVSVDEYQEKLFGLKTQLHEYHRFKDQSAKLKEANAHYEKLEKELADYIESLGVHSENDFANELSNVKAKVAECRFAEKNYNAAVEKKNLFEKENDIDDILLPAECPYSIDELNDMISKVEQSLEEVRNSIAAYNRQLDDLQEQLDMRDEKEQEYRNALALQEEEKHRYDILDSTSEFLTKAKEQFTARYMAPIADGFQKYFGILTENVDRNWQVDANINLKIKEQGQLRDVRTMSAGYQDLIGVCMRFALVDAMYPQEKPFLILDDPFVNLDDEKMARGKQLLIELEKEYQVIYFTCHNSREYKEK